MGYNIETSANVKNELSKFLKILRVKNNETQNDMANKLGITAAYLSSIETGKRQLPIDFEDKIIRLYNLNVFEMKSFTDAIFKSNQEIRMVVNLANNYSTAKKDVIKYIAEEDVSDDVLEKLKAILEKR